MFEKRCKGKRIYLKSQIFHYVFRKSVVDKNVSVCWKGYTEVYRLCQQKKAGERRRRMYFTLKIHDFWKLLSCDIHSQTKPLILYDRDFWKLRSCDIHSQTKPLILCNHDFWKLQSRDIYSQMKLLILCDRGLGKLQSYDRCYRMNLLPSIIHSFGNCALVRASVKWCILGGKHIEFTTELLFIFQSICMLFHSIRHFM